MKKISILGTTYTIKEIPKEKEQQLENAWAYCNYYDKEIVIDNNIMTTPNVTHKKRISFYNKVLRHEIIHAFISESGLRECSNTVDMWATNEEMVDWFAMQSPKIFKIYKQLNIL